jgi:hypothetical protein
MYEHFASFIILTFFALAPAIINGTTTASDTHGQTGGSIQPHPHTAVQPTEGTSSSNGRLRILMMIPVFDFNRSHVNFALGKFRALRQHHHVVRPFGVMFQTS